jgi:hypothetical protein
MAWDASTSAAVAALIVASLALLIASAQVLQQYLITGQLIRLCDSVVFGPLPGQGRRVWQLSQFRFRVVYSIPQISLDTKLWPEQPPHIRSYAIGRHELPRLRRSNGLDTESVEISDEMSSLHAPYPPRRRRLPFGFALNKRLSVPPESPSSYQQVGEAAWVSFCRAVEERCGASVRFDLVEYDADRCPPDLVSAPMQVSMRDVIVMGLMAGMEVTSCSFNEKSVSMQGRVGTITSSSHPVLGPILHFASRNNDRLFFGAFGVRRTSYRSNIEGRWMARTWDVCMVAQRYFRSDKRRTARRLDDRWIREQSGTSYTDILWPHEHESPLYGRKRPLRSGKDRQREANIEDDSGLVASNQNDNNVPLKRHQDGKWEVVMPREFKKREEPNSEQMRARVGESPIHDGVPKTAAPDIGPQQELKPPGMHLRATVEDAPEDDSSGSVHPNRSVILEEGCPSVSSEMKERLQTAKFRQAVRSAKVQNIESDRSLVEESVNRGAMISPYQPSMLLLTQYPHDPNLQGNDEESPTPNLQDNDEEPPKPTTAEEEARMREEERQRLRKQRDDERAERNNARNRAVHLTRVDLFWLCQMNIFQGFWATPWHDNESMPLQSALVGAVTVILEALLGFLDETSLIYTNDRPLSFLSFQNTAEWMFRGSTTYPAYALNARGGVIAEGIYPGVRIPAFRTVIPAVELLYSYEWQVSPDLRDPVRFCEEQNVELMRLDTWLSYVGRTQEISAGRNKLLKQTAALIVLVVGEFEIDFQNIDLSASEGGLQDIQGLAANVMDFLADEELSDAEQLYILIALLRTVKVCQCVLAGPKTREMRDILLQDVQAHLV